MTLVRNAYRQKATYWGSPSPDGAGGFTFSAPREIGCHWQEMATEFTNQAGQIEVSRAIVYVKENLEIGGYLFEGKSTATNPQEVQKAFRIKQVSNIPSIRTADRERRVFL